MALNNNKEFSIPPVCYIRVKTNAWIDNRDRIHIKKTINILKRKSNHKQQPNTLLEDAATCDVQEVMDRIINLGFVKDGVYRVEMCDLKHDPESGYLEDWNYILYPAN